MLLFEKKNTHKDRQKITIFSEAHLTQAKVNTAPQRRGYHVKIKQFIRNMCLTN